MTTPTAWHTGIALMVDRPVDGVTQDLTRSEDCKSTMRYYKGQYFVCESITESAAKAIAAAMGWQWSDTPAWQEAP